MLFFDQFRECEEKMSLNHLFNFRESEKSLNMEFVGVPCWPLVMEGRKEQGRKGEK
jgi:hypothetical protein